MTRFGRTNRAHRMSMIAAALLVVSPLLSVAQVPPPPPPPPPPAPVAPPQPPAPPDPLALLASLEGSLNSVRHAGIKKSLEAKLRSVRASLSGEEVDAAVAKLGAFVHEVEAQSGKHLTTRQAESFKTQAERLIAVLTED